MKLTQKLPLKHFVISQILILSFSLIFLFWLHYTFNIQYQKGSNPFVNGPITLAPKTFRLDLNQPDEDSLTFQSEITVSGKTSPLLDVLISTTSSDLVVKSASDGSFSTVLDLSEGVNSITVIVFDSDGDSRSAERTVYYSKEKI